MTLFKALIIHGASLLASPLGLYRLLCRYCTTLSKWVSLVKSHWEIFIPTLLRYHTENFDSYSSVCSSLRSLGSSVVWSSFLVMWCRVSPCCGSLQCLGLACPPVGRLLMVFHSSCGPIPPFCDGCPWCWMSWFSCLFIRANSSFGVSFFVCSHLFVSPIDPPLIILRPSLRRPAEKACRGGWGGAFLHA